MRGQFKSLIPQNCATSGIDKIGFYRNNIKEYELHLPPQMKAPTGTKLYSFGAVSDVHTYAVSSYTSDSTANTDFVNALNFYKNNVDFLCICGDLGCYGLRNSSTRSTSDTSNSDLAHYKQLVDNNAGTLPIYAIAGNHEWWDNASEVITDEVISQYTGQNLCYSFEHNGDVFIMCGMADRNYAFTSSSIQWLEGVLETNRNKRCFLFCHAPILGYSGDPTQIYPFDILDNTYGRTFINLLRHYKNTLFFHGHTHILYESQAYTQNLNPQVPNCIYDHHLGIHSIHIPSLAIPVNITSGRVVESGKSQGYVIDVYDDCIVLKGRDFIKNKYVSTAIYKLDTTLVEIEANTFGG